MTEPSLAPAPSKYPNRIQLLILFILIPVVWNGFRFIETLVFWKILKEFHARPSPLYMAGTGAVWFVCGIMLLVGVRQRKAWGWYALHGAAICYPFWVWAERFLLEQPHENWPFGITFTLTCLLFVLIILFTSKTKQYFHLRKGTHEPQ